MSFTGGDQILLMFDVLVSTGGAGSYGAADVQPAEEAGGSGHSQETRGETFSTSYVFLNFTH